MKKLITLALFSMLAALCARADVILQETFNYTNGPISVTSTNGTGSTTISNWLTHSGSIDAYVTNRRLEVGTSTAYLGVSVTRSGDVHRVFTNSVVTGTTHQQLFASFIVNFTNLPTGAGAYFAHFYAGSTTFPCRFWALTNGTTLPNTFRMGIQMGSASLPNQVFPVDLALNTDYQVVIGYDPAGLDAASLWINPISPSGASDSAVVTSDAYAPGTSYVNSFAFRQASGFGGFLTVSNLVVATTFDEAATNVLTTNAVAPKIVYQPVASQANFPSAVLAMSAVANGQGLGNMTYKWQVASSTNGAGQLVSPSDVSDSGDITGSKTNLLSFSSAVVGDTGNYDLVVTTPYGLSVTSSVSRLSIVDGPFPPVITFQPVNVTGYQGYSAFLNVSAASPPSGGAVTFTWYSNNVVVSSTAANNGAQTDTGLNSTYGFTSALTNYSATYKVAITNAYGGIVSSNAVMSVILPPSVSIAFLRTLVDPANNWLATNSTIAYQATGIITTYTNITTGNTASYYLQDATAGINIFATFGSTFRPQQGDVVTFVGVMSSFTSGLELFADPIAGDPGSSVPFTSYSIVSNNFPLPTPLVIPFTVTNAGYANMNTNIAGRYVQLTNVFFGTNAGSPIVSGFYTVTNVSGQKFNLWFSVQDQDTQIQGATTNTFPSFAYSVSGVMFGSMNPSGPANGTPNPNFAVAVTKFADINTNVGVTPASASLCAGNSVTLAVTATPQDPSYAPLNYLWSSGATTTSITVTPAITTNYTVTVSNFDNTILVGSVLVPVTVNPLPVTQTIRATSASICSNSPTIISLANSVVGTTYLLQTNPFAGVGTLYGTTNGIGSAVAFTNVFPKVSTTYYVVATNSSGCALTLGSTNITVNPLPVLQAISASSATICSNSSTTISLTSSVNGTTYLLQTNASLGVGTIFSSVAGTGSGISFAAVTPKVTTAYFVLATNVSGCGLTIGSTNITVNPLPITQAISASAASICAGSSITISLASSVVGTTYLLQTNANVGIGTLYGKVNGTGSGVSLPAVTPSASTTYWLLATNSTGCGLALGSTNITVNALPTTSGITGSTNVIVGQSGVSYSVSSTVGSTYGWTVPAGASFTGGTSSSISVTFGSTSGNVSVTETNASGCTGSTVSKSVTVVNVLPVTITGISGSNINYTGGSGLRFILLSSGDLTVVPSVWTRLLTNASTPGSFTIPAMNSSNQFYRIKSE
jgi:hypothetical protein